MQISFEKTSGKKTNQIIKVEKPEESPLESSEMRNLDTHPIPDIEQRTIVWEVKRPILEPLLHKSHGTDALETWFLWALKDQLTPLKCLRTWKIG